MSKNQKYIKVIKDNNFESFLSKKNGNEISTLGSSMDNALSDCHKIKTINPVVKSGFFWIKPRCSPKAMRVFCDFSLIGKGVSFLLFNGNQAPNTALTSLGLESYKDIRYVCAKMGLEPINVKNKDMMKRIMDLLKIFGWNLGEPFTIPLGWDYNCAKDQACSGDSIIIIYNSSSTIDHIIFLLFHILLMRL